MNIDSKVGERQPDSGIIPDDIIDDIRNLGPARPPPNPSERERSEYRMNNDRYQGIQFIRGNKQNDDRLHEATIQIKPGGPVERLNGAVPYQYNDAANDVSRRKDFDGVPLPIRDPSKEFEGPTRFPSHRPGDMLPYTNSTFGMAIQHESHRFGLTTALWPVANRDSHLDDFQPPLSNNDPRGISRIYADPRQPDLVYKIENRQEKSEGFRSDKQRRRKLGRSSKRRRALTG